VPLEDELLQNYCEAGTHQKMFHVEHLVFWGDTEPSAFAAKRKLPAKIVFSSCGCGLNWFFRPRTTLKNGQS
jgi:hypothetical protein